MRTRSKSIPVAFSKLRSSGSTRAPLPRLAIGFRTIWVRFISFPNMGQVDRATLLPHNRLSRLSVKLAKVVLNLLDGDGQLGLAAER